MSRFSRPDLDFVGLARGMGVPGERVDTMDDFNTAVARGLAHKGPYLVEVMLV
jgi:acetolactate synthase I/II/III large subunit